MEHLPNNLSTEEKYAIVAHSKYCRTRNILDLLDSVLTIQTFCINRTNAFKYLDGQNVERIKSESIDFATALLGMGYKGNIIFQDDNEKFTNYLNVLRLNITECDYPKEVYETYMECLSETEKFIDGRTIVKNFEDEI